MKNFEFANWLLADSEINLEIQGGPYPTSREDYTNNLINRIEEECDLDLLHEELVTMEEVGNDFYGYIVHNLKAQCEAVVNINEKYEDLSLVIEITKINEVPTP